MKVKEYSSFDKFEEDPNRQDSELVAVVNKTNGCVCADLVTACKTWQTAVKRFFKALAGDTRFDGWKDSIEDGCKNGFFKDKEVVDGKYISGYFWEVEQLDDDNYYVCLNVNA